MNRPLVEEDNASWSKSGDLELNQRSPEKEDSSSMSMSQLLSSLWRWKSSRTVIIENAQPSAKMRKVPTKVEPKVFFSNERTFLSWLNMAVTLSTISLAVIAFANTNWMSQIYGIILLPVAIAFILYALYTYMKRSVMIRHKDPGPYEDRIGPIVLVILLSAAIIVNFIIKIYEITHV